MRVFTLFALVALVFSASAESFKIGYIDTEIVVSSLTQYQKESISINKEFELKKQELLNLFHHIELARANLNKDDKLSNNDSFDKELARVLKLESSFQKETEYWQGMINQKKIDLLQRLEIVINKAIKEFAVTENYDLILYGNAAYVGEKTNINNKIISIIEEM